MSARRTDHYVGYKAEPTIAEIALNWRIWAENEDDESFDIADYTETFFRNRVRGGPLIIRKFLTESDAPSDLAFVSYKPPTLNFEEKLWEEARQGVPEARYILAHELGHLVLHDSDAKAFSTSEENWLKFGVNENSAEWQAHMFAEYFVLPNHILKSLRFVAPIVISARCRVPLTVVLSALERGKRLFLYTGDGCSACGNFTMVRNGTCLKCDTCGATSACN